MMFSIRNKKKLPKSTLQIESIDTELLNCLWNIIKITYLDRLPKNDSYSYNSIYSNFAKITWHRFYKLPIDTLPYNCYEVENFIRDRFFKCEWYEVYDFIEFLAEQDSPYINKSDFQSGINKVLEEEISAYRFIDSKIVPISNEIETAEIEVALENVINFTALKGANIHLTNALEKLSDRQNPDFRNSIKESISAVETTCRVLTGESTLGKALKSLKSNGLFIDDQFVDGIEKIYAYTNNKQSGIRHAIIEEHNNTELDDAKYMLVICSSFINYLIGKCKNLGIKIS